MYFKLWPLSNDNTTTKTKRSTISKSHKSQLLNLSFPNSVHLHHGTKIFPTDYYKLQSNTNINSIVISLVIEPENSISFSIIIEKKHIPISNLTDEQSEENPHQHQRQSQSQQEEQRRLGRGSGRTCR